MQITFHLWILQQKSWYIKFCLIILSKNGNAMMEEKYYTTVWNMVEILMEVATLKSETETIKTGAQVSLVVFDEQSSQNLYLSTEL